MAWIVSRVHIVSFKVAFRNPKHPEEGIVETVSTVERVFESFLSKTSNVCRCLALPQSTPASGPCASSVLSVLDDIVTHDAIVSVDVY